MKSEIKPACFCETDRQDLNSDKNLFSSHIITPGYQGPRTKVFSTMMTSSGFFLYDHPDILALYPHGFYSDNCAFIPVTTYDRMRECEPLAVITPELKSYWNLCGLIFIPFLIKMVEHKYNVHFTDQEKETILLSALEYSFIQLPYLAGTYQLEWSEENMTDGLDRKYSEDKLEKKYLSHVDQNYLKSSVEEIFQAQSPVYLSNENLAQLGASLGLSNDFVITVRNFTACSTFIDYALLKSSEIYEPGHPFAKLINKIKFPTQILDMVNMEQETYRNFVDTLPVTHAYKIYAAFDALAYQIVQESKNEEELLGKVKGIWSNLAVETNYLEFEVILNSLYKACLPKFSHTETKLYVRFELSEKMAHLINNHEGCCASKRSIIIDTFSAHTGLCANVRTCFVQPDEKSFIKES